MIKLYSGPLSLFTAKVRVALAEKRIAYERIDVAWSPVAGYSPKHPRVVAINPKQQVPVLEDDGVAIYDSTTILEYLEDRYSEPALYPRAPAARARARMLEAEADEVFFPSVRELIYASFYPRSRGEQPDETTLAPSRDAIASYHHRLEEHLGQRAYLCGEFGVADIAQALTVYFAAGLGAPISPARARLSAWYTRVAERPAVADELREMRDALRQAA